jgi:hypothetical protein
VVNARHPQRPRLEGIDTWRQYRPRRSAVGCLRQCVQPISRQQRNKIPKIERKALAPLLLQRFHCSRVPPSTWPTQRQLFPFNNTAATAIQTSRTTRSPTLSYLLPRFLSPIATFAAQQHCIVFGFLLPRIRRFLCLLATVGSIAAVFNTWKAQRVEQRI